MLLPARAALPVGVSTFATQGALSLDPSVRPTLWSQFYPCPLLSGFSCGWPEQGMLTCLPKHCKAALGEACPKPGQAAEGSKAEPLRVDVPSSPFRTCSHYRLANTHPATGWVFVVLEGLSQALVTLSYTCPAGNWNSGSTPHALFWC